jgi:light-regulated signal transduction histidine kinase (bacteriophytochrome)
MAWADRGLLHTVLDNLLGNAWKFTTRTPDPSIEFGSVVQADVTVYFVRDNGAGFDAAHAPNLFRPFHRMHTEAQFPGTGIGLATVDRIIKRHRGRLWVESTRGGGTTVYFTLGTRPTNTTGST